MSDLQCACTALLLRPVSPERAYELAELVRDRRVARVFAASGEPSSATAEVVAGALRVRVEPLGMPDGEPTAALDAISDSYRGETVVVVCDPDTLGPQYATAELTEVAIDGDGWTRVDRRT